MKVDDAVFILSNAKWYGVPQEKFARINQSIEEITEDYTISERIKEDTTSEILEKKQDPEIKKIFKERIFNKKLCRELNGEFFDEQSKQIQMEGDNMEVCDVFIPQNKEFIHTKISTKAATLSHLFTQGYVSARAYASKIDNYISKVNEHILNPENHLDDSENGHQNYTIRYLIINKNIQNKLTFISKLALDKMITDLKGFGYTVKLSWVNGIDLDPTIEETPAN